MKGFSLMEIMVALLLFSIVMMLGDRVLLQASQAMHRSLQWRLKTQVILGHSQ